MNILTTCVNEQKIQAFYPPGSLEPIAQRIAQSGVLDKVATDWRVMQTVIKPGNSMADDVVIDAKRNCVRSGTPGSFRHHPVHR